ncbi:4'-phosphopantetheinyl transferase family protein [Candidatus Bipolaricaulota bacterium]
MASLIERDKRIVAWGRLRYVLSRYLGHLPGDIQIVRTPSGCPEIVSPKESGIRFSLAHSKNAGLVAVSHMPVGIDLECIRPSLDANALSARFFTPNESEAIAGLPKDERVEAFFRVWVRKEAYLKAAGGSVPASLSKCEVSVDAVNPRILVTELESEGPFGQLIDIPVLPGYLAALAVLGDNVDIQIYDLE